MGEYEERYPEVYGSREHAARQDEVRRPASQPAPARPVAGGAPGSGAPGWQHTVRSEPPTASPRVGAGRHFRGVGPRGYVRSPQRIYEDICDRLTDNPFVDASDIDVSVAGTEVRLSGTVESETALLQAEAIAQEVVGVSHVHNGLSVRAGGARREQSAGDQVNRAMHVPPRR